jgi:hypothetical protein
VDQKVRAFGDGLNTISGMKSFVQLVVVSLVMWFMIALAYRQVAHSYPPEPVGGIQENVAALDVDTANLADMPGLAGEPVTRDLVQEIRPGLEANGYTVKEERGEFWLFHGRKREKRIGGRPHLNSLDVSRVLLLMGFSMIGSVVQLPAVGGGSQLAVISALQVVYGIPPELAVSCGILLWLVTFMSCIPTGLILAHREHLSLRQLSAESEREEEATAAAADDSKNA